MKDIGDKRRFSFAEKLAIGDDPYIRMLMQNYNANLKEIEIESYRMSMSMLTVD